ncbi:MAG: universal stress protein [Planctomycetaceae bacterium]|jgi:universal stress protein E|nr:universal stress protein [Planctomycetaceae bacterium]MBT6156029.1 universal stress protein [Planctomycetaceae bacterium]MBT6487530.1 universal stress protein [Planctomycetaceae bacterium]MBT6495843.1 universal stress protein [Planctomycetaceae bacterium]
MQRFRNIVVGVDLSRADRLAASELNAPTQEAVKRAIWMASRLSAELTFFSVLDVSAHTQELLHDGFQKTSSDVEVAAHAALDELVEQAKQQNVAAKSHLAFGSPWIETVKQVLRENHDLCIVGTRDQGVAKRLLFGSTGSKLLRNCPCPVWVTKPDPDIGDLNILIPSDFSDVSSLALELAVNGGQMVDTKIHLLHAIEESVDNRMWLTGLSNEKIAAFAQEKRDEATQSLNDQLAQTDYRSLTHGVKLHVTDGPGDVVILDAIEELKIDLLIMGTIARSGIPGVLIGNTAERLLPHVSCSVLALKPDGWECPIDVDD